jgi:type VI secretion system FHA domain protein
VIEQWTTLELVSSDGMPCKLITQWLEDGREQTVERAFDHARITIGRGVGNNFVLKDPTRVVSAKHAEIRGRQGVWSVCDVGSTNGTILNGTKIAPKEEHELHNGDRITIGPYQLLFQSVAQPTTPGSSRETAPPVVPSWGTLATDPERLQYILQRAYGDFENSSDGNLESHLESVLRRAVEGCDRATAQSAVQALRTLLRSSTGQASDVRKEVPPAKVDLAPVEPRRQESKKRFLSGDRARGVYDELAVPGSSLNPDQMAKQLTSVLQAVCVGLADAVRGRREFQKEFEVEATRILAWKPNPIKHAENAAEVATILLDPTSSGLSDEEVIASLKEVFQDLTLHQLGLMAGFRECIRGLLKELDPEVLGKVQPGEPKGKGMGLLSGGRIRSEAAAWRRYMEKHRQLTEEEVKVFERILAPHFTKGYLSVHKTRTRA